MKSKKGLWLQRRYFNNHVIIISDYLSLIFGTLKLFYVLCDHLFYLSVWEPKCSEQCPQMKLNGILILVQKFESNLMWLLTCRVPKARASPNQNDCLLRASVKIHTVETLQKCILVFLVCRQFKADSDSTCCCQFSLEAIHIFQAQPFISQIPID